MEKVLTTREAAKLLGVSLRTIQLWVESGVLKAWKTAGGHRRISSDSVDALRREKSQALGAKSGAGRLRILVVEDEPDILRLYRMMIENWGLPVELITAANGFEGLIRLGQYLPDVLITDLRMPGMDGLEMIHTLSADHEFEGMEIIVVSAVDPHEVRKRNGLPNGVKFFAKPIPFDKIEKIVRQRLLTGRPRLTRTAS